MTVTSVRYTSLLSIFIFLLPSYLYRSTAKDSFLTRYIYSKVLLVQICVIYYSNRKHTMFVLCALGDSTSSPFFSISENRVKTRKEFMCFRICEMLRCYSSTARFPRTAGERTTLFTKHFVVYWTLYGSVKARNTFD